MLDLAKAHSDAAIPAQLYGLEAMAARMQRDVAGPPVHAIASWKSLLAFHFLTVAVPEDQYQVPLTLSVHSQLANHKLPGIGCFRICSSVTYKSGQPTMGNATLVISMLCSNGGVMPSA